MRGNTGASEVAIVVVQPLCRDLLVEFECHRYRCIVESEVGEAGPPEVGATEVRTTEVGVSERSVPEVTASKGGPSEGRLC